MRCKYFFNDGGITTCDNAIRGAEVDRMNCPYSVPKDCKYAEVERPPDATGLIDEFLEDLKKEIEYIKTINNYQLFAGELKQCIRVEKLEEQINNHIIEKWEAKKVE